MKIKKSEEKKEEGEEVKEPNPDILESAFDVADHVGTEEVAEDDEDPLLSVGGSLEEDDMIDSGDFRVVNDW